MAGFPHHALERYLRKLLQAGHRVAVCDQVEDAAQAKGLVRREVTRVVTPGTLTEDDLLDPRQANHLVALRRPAAASRSAWPGSSCPPASSRPPTCRATGSPTSWAGWRPPECLCAETTATTAAACCERLREPPAGLTRDARPDWTFDPTSARAALFHHFGVTHPGRLRLRRRPAVPGRRRGTAALPAGDAQGRAWPTCSRLRPYRRGPLPVPRRGDAPQPGADAHPARRRPGRLAAGASWTAPSRRWAPGCCRTGCSPRWPTAPPSRPGWTPSPSCWTSTRLRQELRASLSEAFDLQRLTARVSTGRASPRDLAAVGRTLRLLPRLKAKVTARRAAAAARPGSAGWSCAPTCARRSTPPWSTSRR